MEVHLQSIIGTDRKNPYFTVLKDTKNRALYVYFGACLMEIISDKPDNPNLKHLIARLFNAGVKRKNLIKNFGYSYGAMKRWAEALKTGDAQIIVHALAGQGAPKKLTTEIRSFAAHRFKSEYAENKYSYSQIIRDEIAEIFQIDISSETLRPLFNELKETYFKKKEL